MYDVGDVIRVRPCQGGYELPAGLPSGALVKIVECLVGYYRVEYKGQAFTVAFPCVETIQ